jgi:hypothetical protein
MVRSKDVGGKSFKSKKIVNGNEYKLSICEKCLVDKYPDYNNKNKSRVFNQMNKYSKYAYSIDDNDYEIQKNLYVLTTEKSLIRKYGVKEGRLRWESYKNKQAFSNTFEYKKEKHGWDERDFNEYNKSRSVTIDNLILRHGYEKGHEIWENYINKQKVTKSKEYYVNKYGLLKWGKLCESKAHTLANYIKWYGSKKIAIKKIKERHNMWSCVSKSSQKYLTKFDEYLKKNNNVTTLFDSIDGEYMIITESNKVFYLDYYIEEWDIGIEYNGDLFHANPNIYLPSDTPIPGSDLTASEIWEKDEIKLKTIQEEMNIPIITIWESDLPSYEKLLEKVYELRDSRN